MGSRIRRLALVVSHPIQYYAPLYQRLAKRDDLEIRVFFTWHAGEVAVQDHGFGVPVSWDIPLTAGYESELVPNLARDPGTHHFFGLSNPSLLRQVQAWGPDVVHITGWAWWSHLQLMRSLHRLGVPQLFRGDSHLRNSPRRGLRWWAKRILLRRVFSWPSKFLYVGQANREYYRAFGVDESRLHYCTHAIDTQRFAEPSDRLERQAAEWRRDLHIGEGAKVLLFVGKFDVVKQPLMLMRAVREAAGSELLLVIAGGGALEAEVRAVAASEPSRFRVLPFQNQSRMPVVYRLGDLFVLPSMGDTWGLAVNEALACGRPVLVSDRVGCAADVVDDTCGRIFPFDAPGTLIATASELFENGQRLLEMGRAAARRSRLFDVRVAEEALVQALAGGGSS